MVSDDPHEKIKLKMFHAELVNDTSAITEEMNGFKEIPPVRELDAVQVTDNYYQIKQDIQILIEQEVYRLKMQEEEIDEL